MAAWFLFAILVFLVFGVPLIDEVYRRRTRRAAKNACEMAHVPNVTSGPSSEQPHSGENMQEGQTSHDDRPAAKALEEAS
jgi:hypothetical protein